MLHCCFFLDCEQQYLLIVKLRGKLDAHLYAEVQKGVHEVPCVPCNKDGQSLIG